MLLQNKNAVIYGAGGSLGGAVAKAFAKAGAKVFLTGRNLNSVQKVADELINAEVAEVDAFNEQQIKDHLNTIGKVDISFNAAGIDNKQGVPLVDMTMDEYVTPVTKTLQTQFLTATAAAKIMMKQGGGIILTLTATPGGIGYPFTGGFAAACCALENFSSNLAAEVGAYGVRG